MIATLGGIRKLVHRFINQRVLCSHPSDEISRHTVGVAEDYGHFECERCGHRWGHWDHV